MNKVKLSKICEVKKGKTITKKKITEGDVPVIAGGQQPAYYHNEPNRNGDVITVSGSGAYAGFVNFFTKPIFASDCTTIQSLDESKVLTKYVFYLLKGRQDYIYSLQRGAGQPHVYPKDLINIEIPLPPLPIQKQIVSILEKAENLKQKRSQTNKETQKIIQSLFYEMFGDPVKNEKGWDVEILDKLCEIKSGGTPSRQFPEFFKGTIPWITTVALGQEYVDINDAIELITEDAVSKSATKIIPEGSIMMGTRVGVGKISINTCQMCTNQDIVSLININQKLNKNFLKWQLRHYNNFFNIQKQGATIQGIQMSLVKNLNLIIPPYELQLKFEKIVDGLVLIQSKQQESTQEINTIFDALMQKAFKGELV